MWIEAHATLCLSYQDGTIFWCCHTGGSDWRIVRAEISWEAVTPGDRQPRRLSHLYAAPLPPRPEGPATWHFRPAATQLRSPAVVQLLRSPGIAWTVRTFRTFWRLRLHPFWSGKPGFEHLAASKQWDNGRFELKWLVLKESELLRLSQTCNLKGHISLKHWSTAQTAHVTWVTWQFFTSFKCTSAVALGFSGAALGARLCLASKVGEIFHLTFSLVPSLFSFMPMSQWVNVVDSKIQTLQKTSRITFWNGVMPLCLTWCHLENHSKSAEICMRFLSKICYWGSTSIIQRWPRSICCCWIRWSTRKVGSLLILLRPQRAKPNAEMIGCGGRNGEFPEHHTYLKRFHYEIPDINAQKSEHPAGWHLEEYQVQNADLGPLSHSWALLLC